MPDTKNQVFINEFPKEIAQVMKTILRYQQQIYNYHILNKKHMDILVKDAVTNMKPWGTATLFDCVFTDVDDFNI